MTYAAIINVPGYLPMADEPATFDTAREAWDYLAEERERDEDDLTYADLGIIDGHNGEFACAMSPAWHEICEMSDPGTVYGDTPGYDGDHDLGLAYSVVEMEN